VPDISGGSRRNHAGAASRALESRQASNLATVASAVEHEGVGPPKGVTVTWQKHATNRPLRAGKTHVSTFTVRSDASTELPDVDVEPISLMRTNRGTTLNYLRGIVSDIYPILVECETGKPLSPFAPYPL
jgi:hypothetical protein